jgi:hypothetical protein
MIQIIETIESRIEEKRITTLDERASHLSVSRLTSFEDHNAI